MKYYTLPTSFVDELMPEIPAGAQAVLFALLWYSDKKYKPVWCGIKSIMHRAGIKSDRTVRNHIQFLEEKKVIIRQKVKAGKKTKYGKWFDAEYSVYTFNFQVWIEKDIQNGKAKAADYAGEEAIREIAEATVSAMLSRLPHHVKVWLNHMEYTGQYNNVLHFKQKEPLPKAAVVQAFNGEGLKISIAN